MSLTLDNPTITYKHQVLSSDESIKWMEWTDHALFDDSGNLSEYQSIGRDVTDSVKVQEAIKSSELKYRTIFEATGSATLLLNSDMTITLANSKFEKFIGYSKEEIEGKKNFSDFLEKHDFYKFKEYCQIKQSNKFYILNDYEYQIIGKQGSIRDVYLTCNLIPETESWIVSLLDITERKKAEKKTQYLALHDNLTGLPNRTLFFDRLDHAISRANRYKNSVALLYIDLDGFKPVNDTFGHDIGDKVLQEAAIRIKNCIRDSDTAARIGGDEFAVILQDLLKKEFAAVVAEKIIKSVSSPINAGTKRCTIGASIGISIYDHDTKESDVMLKQADIAMYNVKKNGKNNYLFYEFSKLTLD